MIVEHLALNNKLHIAAKEILENGRLSVMDVATKYGLEFGIINRKINIMKRKEEFYKRKRKFDAARKEMIEEKSTNNAVAKRYGIKVRRLYEDVKKARAQENYEYDRKIGYNGIGFTYMEEKLLLQNLKNWAKRRRKSLQNLCSCQLCALEQLSTRAYEFSQQNNIKCPSLWNAVKLASVDWLEEFEMRHSDEISNSFDSLEKCLKQIQADE
ncbi:hypothetical protein RF55_11190 [Lasius niger]|uniref:Uncharacterized protein n=1 Tax=Lasius niger TaxID=67767 RepID=A0A0J7N922_LASNI|nr:hypothetical protein RF55_11248 [Lasius niger]KMQ89200.1 hypothetical protein RF55_11190 [Lasius niger]